MHQLDNKVFDLPYAFIIYMLSLWKYFRNFSVALLSPTGNKLSLAQFLID